MGHYRFFVFSGSSKKYNLEYFSWDYKDTCQIPYLKVKYFINSKTKLDETKPFFAFIFGNVEKLCIK